MVEAHFLYGNKNCPYGEGGMEAENRQLTTVTKWVMKLASTMKYLLSLEQILAKTVVSFIKLLYLFAF